MGLSGGSREAPVSADERFEIITVDGHHSQYVHTGALTDAPGAGGIIGMLLFVVDRDGWATLHRAEAVRYQNGKQLVSFGPRLPWPDGSIAARKTDHQIEAPPEPPVGASGQSTGSVG